MRDWTLIEGDSLTFRPARLWHWLTNPRVREVRRMTRRGYTLEWGSDGRTFWN